MIMILTLNRDGRVIATPRSSRELQVGDRLVCFGKLETMKAFLPPRKKRRPKRLRGAKEEKT